MRRLYPQALDDDDEGEGEEAHLNLDLDLGVSRVRRKAYVPVHLNIHDLCDSLELRPTLRRDESWIRIGRRPRRGSRVAAGTLDRSVAASAKSDGASSGDEGGYALPSTTRICPTCQQHPLCLGDCILQEMEA